MAQATTARRHETKSLASFASKFTHQNIERGIAASVIGDIVAADILSRSEIAHIVPARTLARRISAREQLKVTEADAIGRVLRLAADAERIFRDRKFAREWLRSPNPALNDRAPLDLAQTDAGARAAEAVLARIAYGDYS